MNSGSDGKSEPLHPFNGKFKKSRDITIPGIQALLTVADYPLY
jgi:hypothetical protein